MPAGGAIQRKSFWKVASLKHAQVLREGCAFANGVVVRIIVRNVVTHRLAWQVQGLAAIDVPTSGYVAATVTATAITPQCLSTKHITTIIIHPQIHPPITTCNKPVH